ncbi:MAG: hypothetical protein PHH59_16700 [Methylovulum sp.]|uniref:hypothetical protein n=1 Tax=Methylovulum sp. TaxID=1916980 RepID=UPI00261C1A67|nr:hypothetical protein [Methylovulum sp.]MDD2725640.1 hypothetical protein [Methylovulum sp.]MDD5125948.1 hypothetical protein [Methylovulum sp.]
MQNVSGILDVAIGLVFVYLLLSLVCSALTEAVENLFNRCRGKKLCEGLYELFGGNIHNDTSFALLKEFYQSPLIYGLYQGDLKIEQQASAANTTQAPPQKLQLSKNLPSYIAPKTFALALVGHILAGDTFDTATLINKINSDSSPLPEHLKKTLVLLVNTAEGDINTALKNIEDWYSAMGERISGWYKKHAQRIAFVIALLITVMGNVDTITIAKSLMVNDKLREQIIDSADQFVKIDALADKEAALKALNSIPLPDNKEQIAGLASEIVKIKAAHAEEALCQSETYDPKQCYDLQMARLDKLNQMGLPISWMYLDDPKMWPQNHWVWLEKILGLFITAIAVSLGAPFWFDVLNKFMNFRSSIKPQLDPKPVASKPQTSGNDNSTSGVG